MSNNNQGLYAFFGSGDTSLYKMNLRLRIFIYFAIAAILPTILLWFFVHAKIDNKLKADYRNLSYNTIAGHIHEVDEFFERQAKIVDSISNAYPYIENSQEGISSFLKNQASINEHILNLYIIRKDGTLVTNEGVVMNNKDFSQLPIYQSAAVRQNLVWLEPYQDEVSGQEVIGIAIPLRNMNYVMDGVLIANLTMDYINGIISDTDIISKSEIYMINQTGQVKFTTLKDNPTLSSIEQPDFILQKVSGDIMKFSSGTHDIEHNGVSWLCTYMTLNTTKWKIVVLNNSEQIVKNIELINEDIYKSIAVFGSLALILILLLSIFLSNSISKPLLKLRDGVKELSLGNLDHVITLDGMEEIRVVADTFNQLSFNLKSSYKDLFNRTEELYEKNENLQEMNAELESSYQQLGATMEQLNESEEKYRKLVNNISDLVVVLNNDVEIVYANNSVENIIGYPAAALIGKPLKEILKDDLNQETVAACYANDYHEFQLKMSNNNGRLIFMEGSTRRIIEHDKVVGIQAIVRDITQRKLMEDELRSRYSELQAINRVTSTVTETLNLDEILDIVVDQVLSASQGLCCLVGLMDEEDDFILKSVKGHRLEDKSTVNVDSTKQQTLKLIGNKKYYIMESFDENELPSDYFKLMYREEGYRYTLFNPIVAHDKPIGLISTLLKSRPSQELCDLITSIGTSVGLSIDNAKAYENVKMSYLKTVQSLVSAVEAKDQYTESHSLRVAKYATFIAAELKMDKEYLEDIWVAGVLHDIGKIGISDSILNKKDRLTSEEYTLVKQHPEIAHKILSNIGLNERIMKAVLYHHERFDGQGYPEGLMGDNIDMMAAIISAADAFDAITSQRPYKESKSLEAGIEELKACKGTQFNPLVVDVFSEAYAKRKDILQQIFEDKEVRFF